MGTCASELSRTRTGFRRKTSRSTSSVVTCFDPVHFLVDHERILMGTTENAHADDEVRLLILNEGDDKSDELMRVKKGWTIQVKVSSVLSSRKVRLFSNVVLNEGDRFERKTYHESKWIYPSTNKYDDSDRYAVISCSQSGSFHYYFTIDGTT